MTSKIGLVYSFDSSPWVSCHKIVSNLLLAYEHISKDHELVHLNFNGEDSAESWKSIKQATEIEFDYLIFLDHKPHPLHFLELYFGLQKESVKTKLIFHIFGDFTLHLDKWRRLFKLMEGRSVYFLAASERQKSMLTEFIPAKHLGVCPFPVHQDEFGFSSELRKQIRDSLSIKDDETIFLYTGRISYQKQIHHLIKSFADWRQKTNSHSRLILVGEPDSIGRPFEDRGEWQGEYFQFIQDTVSELVPSERTRIEFHGFKSSNELVAYYSGADFFINLSLHQDEDYGMSCAEALACGLPLILSDWAGFASFKKNSLADAVKLIPVDLTDQGPVLHTDLIAPELSLACQSPDIDRTFIIENCLSYFDINSVGELIRQFITQPIVFEGGESFINEVAYLERWFSNNTYYNHRERKYNDNYLRMYKHYVKTT